MKIVLKPKEATVLEDIFPGTVFIANEKLYLKIIESCDYNVVRLSDGKLCWFDYVQDVEPIYGTFVLKEETLINE